MISLTVRLKKKCKVKKTMILKKLRVLKIIKDIETQEKSGKISEDEKFRVKVELQKMVNEVGNLLEQLFSKKEREISE